MTIQDILNEYNITISNDEYMLEHFLNNKNFKTYTIDFLPKITPSNNMYKYDQIELTYSCAKKSKKHFQLLENRYFNVFTKLWIYGDVFVVVDSVYSSAKRVRKYLDKEYRKHLPLISIEKNQMTEVKEKDILIFYAMLSTREIANVVYYIKGLDVLIFTNWSCFSVLFLKDTNLNFVENLVKSEGLFLR